MPEIKQPNPYDLSLLSKSLNRKYPCVNSNRIPCINIHNPLANYTVTETVELASDGHERQQHTTRQIETVIVYPGVDAALEVKGLPWPLCGLIANGLRAYRIGPTTRGRIGLDTLYIPRNLWWWTPSFPYTTLRFAQVKVSWTLTECRLSLAFAIESLINAVSKDDRNIVGTFGTELI